MGKWSGRKRGNDERWAWKDDWIRPKVSIGIDQSYTRTGISISYKGKIKRVSWIDFKGMKTKTEKRRELSRVLRSWLDELIKHYDSKDIAIICERIRTFSSPIGDDFSYNKPVMSISYIKSTGALIAAIVDTAYDYGVQVYSVDTRAWKTAILGSSKPDLDALEVKLNPQKIRAIKFVLSQGFGEQIKIKKSKGQYTYCDDAADSACISLYAFIDMKKLNLKFES